MNAFMLVHGGAHGAWCWEPLRPHLDGTVVAVDLPPTAIRGVPGVEPLPDDLTTVRVSDFADSVVRAADAAGIDRFVLVGHSMGGLTIAEVARRHPERVSHLVFLSAVIPAEGSCFIDALPPERRGSARETAKTALEGVRVPDAVTRVLFCNDMTPVQTQFVLDHIGLEAVPPWTEPVSRVGLPASMPVTYIRLLRDQCLDPNAQDQQIKNLQDSPGCEVSVVELDAGHNPMISMPEALGDILRHLA